MSCTKDINKDGERFLVADPAKGKVKLDREEFLDGWLCGGDTGLVVLAEPTEKFMPGKEEGSRFAGLLSLIKDTVAKHRRQFIAVLLMAVFGMCADIALPLMLQQTVDKGIADADISLVWLLALSQLCVYAGYYLTDTLSEYLMTRLGLEMGIEMIASYLRNLVGRPMEFFERKVSSDLIQKAEDQNRLKSFMLSTPQSVLFAVLTLVVFSAMLVYYSIPVFLLFISLTLGGTAWALIFLRRRKSIDYSMSACSAENRNNLYELVNGMPEIKTNNAEHVRLSKWTELQQRANRLAIRSYFLQFYINGGQTFIMRMRDIIITGVCATLVIKGSMTIGAMMTVSYIAGRLAQPFATLVSSIFSVQDATLSYERVEEILNAPIPDDEPRESQVLEGDIILNKVSFKYPGAESPLVLDDISMTITPGTTVALVGPSGCGKSTLMKILMGLYEPVAGEVRVGDTVLRQSNSRRWLRHCGIVMQTGTIFTGTLAENIALGDCTPDLNRIESVLDVACLNDFVKSLPLGYHTRLGVSGVELSGGQRQRLLIARALYKSPDIIALDEATSSLDVVNEHKIVANIQAYKGQRTLIVAAHRLSTVRNADVIYYLENGRITEYGSHDSLMALNGSYASLVRGQL